MSKPIIESQFDFFFDSSIEIGAEENSLFWNIIWSGDDFKLLPDDTRIFVYSIVGEVIDARELFDI